MHSKVVLFFVLTICCCGIIGCENKLADRHPIPYIPVNVRIDLWMADYQNLKTPYQPIYLNQYNGKTVGYRENGIIVIRISDNEYKCFDATCTKDPDAGTHLEITKGSSTAVCPTCGTEFILQYGYPDKKEGDTEKIYPLKEYPVKISNNTLIISY